MNSDEQLDYRRTEKRIELTRSDCKDLHALIFAAEQDWPAMSDWMCRDSSDEQVRKKFADDVHFIGNKLVEIAKKVLPGAPLQLYPDYPPDNTYCAL